jgi:hypothetical protein
MQIEEGGGLDGVIRNNLRVGFGELPCVYINENNF